MSQTLVSHYRREESKLMTREPKVRNMGSGKVKGPRACHMGEGCLASREAQSEGRSRSENGSSEVARMREAVRTVIKQLVESQMEAMS